MYVFFATVCLDCNNYIIFIHADACYPSCCCRVPLQADSTVLEQQPKGSIIQAVSFNVNWVVIGYHYFLQERPPFLEIVDILKPHLRGMQVRTVSAKSCLAEHNLLSCVLWFSVHVTGSHFPQQRTCWLFWSVASMHFLSCLIVYVTSCMLLS